MKQSSTGASRRGKVLSRSGRVLNFLKQYWLATAMLVIAGSSTGYAVSVTELRANNDLVSTSNPLPVTGSITSTPGVVGNGTAATAARVTVASDSTGTLSVSGTVADASADSGNPIKVGAIYESTLPTYTTGQRGNIHLDSRGAIRAKIIGATATGADGLTNTLAYATQAATDTTQSGFAVTPFMFNGSTWDRAFTCPSTATVSVTAGNTTEIVALTASQIIRVCSFAVSMSAAGTAKFVYGTGTNCGTGQADITAAINLGTTTPLAMTASAGSSVLRTIASNALCVTAATGNVTGFVTYAKF